MSVLFFGGFSLLGFTMTVIVFFLENGRNILMNSHWPVLDLKPMGHA